MPRIGSTQRDLEIAATCKLFDTFRDGFRRNTRGNLSRRWGEAVITIFFQKRGGGFAWSIMDGGETQFAAEPFETQEGAVSAAFDFLEGL